MRSSDFSAVQAKAANKQRLVASLSRGNALVAAELRLLLKIDREPMPRYTAHRLYCR